MSLRAFPSRLSLIFIALIALAGCRAAWPPPEVKELAKGEAGRVAAEALRSQGYTAWRGEDGLAYKRRSRRGGKGRSVTTVDEVRLDLLRPRIAVRASAGGGKEELRVYDGKEYRAERAGRPVRDPALLVEGRLRTLREYLIAVLPFALARWPAELELIPEVKRSSGRYRVVKARFRPKGPLPPEGEYSLYFRATTYRLEKVFFRVEAGARKGSLVRCDLDNFEPVGDALVPVHRRFYVVDAEDAPRKGPPFLEEWLEDVRFEGVPEEWFRR